jgi:hypothetical protein
MGGYQFRVICAGDPEPIAYFKRATDAQSFMAAAMQPDGIRPCQLLRMERLYGQLTGHWLNPDELFDDLADQEVQ